MNNYINRNKELYYISKFFCFFSLITNFIFCIIFCENYKTFFMFFITLDILKIYLSKSFFNSFIETKKLYFENIVTLIFSILISFLSICSFLFLEIKKTEIKNTNYTEFLQKNTIVKKGEKRDVILFNRLDSIYKNEAELNIKNIQENEQKNKYNYLFIFLFSEIIFYLTTYFFYKYEAEKKIINLQEEIKTKQKLYQKKYRKNANTK